MAAERISEPADVASGVHANGALAGCCCSASRGSIDRAAQDRDRLLARPSIRGRQSAINGWLRVIHLAALIRIQGLLLLHKCRLRGVGEGALAPGPAPTRNPDPACAPTPAGTPTPARTPTPAGTPAPPAAVPAAAAVPTPTAMPARSVAPGMSGAEIGRGGKGGEGDHNHHQEFTCHKTLLSRPPIGSGPAEV